MNDWIPDDQHGHSIAICACENGPHLGTRRMGQPDCCERCGFMTRKQWEFLVQSVLRARPRTSIVPTDQDYEDAKEYIASLIREKVAAGSRLRDNRAIHAAYGYVIDALYAEWAETDTLREWAFGQLDRIVNAVKGEPAPLSQHSLHDVAEQVERVMR